MLPAPSDPDGAQSRTLAGKAPALADADGPATARSPGAASSQASSAALKYRIWARHGQPWLALIHFEHVDGALDLVSGSPADRVRIPPMAAVAAVAVLLVLTGCQRVGGCPGLAGMPGLACPPSPVPIPVPFPAPCPFILLEGP